MCLLCIYNVAEFLSYFVQKKKKNEGSSYQLLATSH